VYLPEGVALVDLILLSAASFMGSLLTAALGVGGGAFLITVMAGLVPPLALIPLHGVVQLGSNASRAWLSRSHLELPKLGLFSVGALGAALGGVWMIGLLSTDYIPLLIALFILWITWMPMPEIGLGRTPLGLISGGLITTLASFLVGASGPLVSAWLSKDAENKWRYTALFSSAMTFQHFLKILVFGLVGFAFLEWVFVLFCMIVLGYLGTKVGLTLLGRLPETRFRTVYQWFLTLLAVRLLLGYV
tara:strand:+ start:25 stop:765 length:741 start_codon:yes stop_codon:yes gene_type:complete